MTNITVIAPILAFCAVGVIGFGVHQWFLNRKPLPQVPSGRIIRATLNSEERKHFEEWN